MNRLWCILPIMNIILPTSARWVDLFSSDHLGVPLDSIVDVSCSEQQACWLVGGYNGTTGAYKVADTGMEVVKSAVVGSRAHPKWVGSIAMQNGWEGVLGGISVGYGGTYFTVTGRVFNTSMDYGTLFEAHSTYSLGNHMYAVIGIDIDLGMGPSLSINGGLTFQNRWWPQGFAPGCFPRFGAFPNSSTWYIAGGAYPGMITNAAGTSEGSVVMPNITKPHVISDNYTAVITKTSDGGVTWKMQFFERGSFYYNEISCWNTSRCAAIGEGNGTVHIYLTTDGETWSPVYESPESRTMKGTCLHAVINGTTGWAVTTGFEGATFLHTVDMGATWNVSSIVPGIEIVTGMTLFDSYGYAAARTMDGYATVLGLGISPNPSPQPVPEGYYVVSLCAGVNCTSCKTERRVLGSCVSRGRNDLPGSFGVVCNGDGTFSMTSFTDVKCGGLPSLPAVYPTQACISLFGAFATVSCPGEPAVRV
eukprot:TRINITY_DN24353_c0_g1_i1.p1 TRINITY_DN24353_c0_g1~~TRINITY_DN24353_c0_g1_i1.p1  ORF type:complete len:493 (+),score=55.49 TRINITY_DN24353_c0_g1_i1:50-1480(+)